MTSMPAVLKPRVKVEVSARDLSSQENPRTKGMRDNGLAALEHPFAGVTSGGKLQPGLFSIKPSGASTAPIKAAAEAFLASLPESQRAGATFPVDGNEWRAWSNVHMFLMRHGAGLEGMSGAQREAALNVMRQSFSDTGYETARNIMKLNETIRELTGHDKEFSDWLYWLSIMGTPSDSQPWGWQIDGHHLIVNCFLLGDQIVATPTFMGSEPTTATEGKYAGTSVFGEEEGRALELAQSLSATQRETALISPELPDEVVTAAFKDNEELPYAGLRFDSLSVGQRDLALSLIGAYTGRLRAGHAEAWQQQVRDHLDETYLSWAGGFEPDDVFYYRVHSPVILIEFDHLRGIALENDVPTRSHIHTIVRTPNGGDYGRDLLRQHYANHAHPA